MNSRNDRRLERTRAFRAILSRKWLTHNRIFFETVVASLLAIAAILASWSQIRQMQIQNEFSKRQTELVELQSAVAMQGILPQFIITARQLKDPNSEVFDEDKILVENAGGLARDLRASFAVFVELETVSHDIRAGRPSKTLIPLNGYYFAILNNPRSKAEAVWIQGHNNNLRFSTLDKELRSAADARGVYAHIEIYRYVRLSYLDVFDKSHTDYYYVPLIHGAHKLSIEEGAFHFKLSEDAFTKGRLREFDKLTGQRLLDYPNDKATK